MSGQEKQPHHRSQQARMAMLEQLASQAEEVAAKEAEEKGFPIKPLDDDAPAKQEESGEERRSEEQKQEEQQEQKQEEQKPVDLSKQKVIAKVDGQEEEVEIECLTSQYQKFRHADQQMKNAAEERKRVEQERREVEMLRQQMLDMHALKMKELEQGQKSTLATAAEKTPEVKDALSTLLLGDEEKAAKSLEDAINAKVQAELERRLQEQSTRFKAEAEQAAQQKITEAEQRSRWESAVSKSHSKNPEIFKDDDLVSLWEQKARDAFNKGMTQEQAADFASESLQRFVRKDPEPKKEEGFKVDQAELREVEAKKAEAKRYQVDGRAVAVSAGKKQDEERELSDSEIIAEMRALRMRPKLGNRAI